MCYSFAIDILVSILSGILAGIISGAIVYCVTSHQEKKRQFELEFLTDQQALSRSLGMLSVLVNCLEEHLEACRLGVRMLVEYWPVTNSFAARNISTDVFTDIESIKQRAIYLIDRPSITHDETVRLSGDIQKARIRVVELNWRAFYSANGWQVFG